MRELGLRGRPSLVQVTAGVGRPWTTHTNCASSPSPKWSSAFKKREVEHMKMYVRSVKTGVRGVANLKMEKNH